MKVLSKMKYLLFTAPVLMLTGCKIDAASVILQYLPGAETLVIGAIVTTVSPILTNAIGKLVSKLPRAVIGPLDAAMGTITDAIISAVTGLPSSGAQGALFGLLGTALRKILGDVRTAIRAGMGGNALPTVADTKVYVKPTEGVSAPAVSTKGSSVTVTASSGFTPWSK